MEIGIVKNQKKVECDSKKNASSKREFKGRIRLKVCHLSSVHNPLDIRIFQKECKTLVKAGHEVVFIVPFGEEKIIDGVRIMGVSKPNNRIVRMLWTTWKVVWAAWHENPQVCHIHDPELLPWAQILRLKKIRLIYDMHENTPKAISTKAWIPKWLRKITFHFYKNIEWLLLINTPVIFAEKSYPKDYSWVQKKAVILNLPLVDQLCHINYPKHPTPTVGYIGGISQDRGSFVTLEAIRVLKHQGLQINIELIGPYGSLHSNALKDYINQYQLNGVSFRGYLPPGEGHKRLARCHVGLAILRPIPNYLESYPTKMFEYMALGLPVIVSNFPLYKEVVEKSGCGICINPEKADELACAIQWMVDHPEESREMGLRGKAEVLRNFNWSSEGKRLEIFYEEVLV